MNDSPLTSAEEFSKILDENNVIVVEATAGMDARASYETGHIAWAVFVDLNEQLSDIPNDFAQGGRHPLPSIAKFSMVLEDLGISPDSHVIIYDRAGGANAAARFWWMLKSVGHQFVQVLNGGFLAAQNAGIPIDNLTVSPKPDAKYPISAWQWPTIAIDELETSIESGQALLIDAREEYRYEGESEPIDLIAGHIPGAINVPFTSNLMEDGHFLSAEELQKKYEKVLSSNPQKEAIVYCGSGVTACHDILAMYAAGFPPAKLYVGSWSEWSRNHKPMVLNEA